MTYYGGDYYGGDYYGGDPGIFGGIGRLFKTGAKIAAGAALGYKAGPIGVILGGAAATAGEIRERITSGTLEAGGMSSGYTPVLRAKHAAALVRGGSSSAPVRGAITGGQRIPQMGMMGMDYGAMAGMGMGRMRRLHWNRSTYVTRGGGTSRWPVGLAIHPKGTEAVTSRRMNVGNARALRRALRRARGFAKLARRVLVAVRHYKGGGGGRRVSRVSRKR